MYVICRSHGSKVLLLCCLYISMAACGHEHTSDGILHMCCSLQHVLGCMQTHVLYLPCCALLLGMVLTVMCCVMSKVLFKLLNRGLFTEIHGCVSTGKEANVYYAAAPEGKDLAIKVYKTSILVFKDRDRCACVPPDSCLVLYALGGVVWDGAVVLCGHSAACNPSMLLLSAVRLTPFHSVESAVVIRGYFQLSLCLVLACSTLS